MGIVGLHKKTHGTISHIAPSAITPDQVKHDHDLAIRWYAELLIDDITTIIDLSLVFTETKLGKLTTWDEINNNFTEAIILAYAAPLPNFTNPEKYLTSMSLLNSLDFELSYTSLTSPEERNIKQSKWRLKDLAIRKINPKNTTDLNNCLCSINGLISRPILFKDELLLKDGATFITSTSKDCWPSITLLDFTNLGSLEIIPFSNCTTKFKSAGNVPDPYADIEFYLPKHISLQNKTIFPVIAHSLFFQDSLIITSPYSISLSPYKLPIATSLLKRMNHQESFVDNTTIVYSQQSTNSYITSEMLKSDHYGAFFVIVDTPNIYIEKTHTVNFSDTVYTTQAKDGVLFDQTTQSFYDYILINYDSQNDIYTNPARNIYPIDRVPDERLLSIRDWSCIHNDVIPSLAESNYYILKLIGV